MKRLLPIGRPVAASSVANGNSVPAARPRERGLGPGAEVRPRRRPGERPAPDRRVERDLGEARDVLEAERLEADDAALERDGLDPTAVGHAAMVGTALMASGPGR